MSDAEYEEGSPQPETFCNKNNHNIQQQHALGNLPDYSKYTHNSNNSNNNNNNTNTNNNNTNKNPHQRDLLSTRNADRPKARWALLTGQFRRNNINQSHNTNGSTNTTEEDELGSEGGRSGHSVKSSTSIRSTLSLSNISRKLKENTSLLRRHRSGDSRRGETSIQQHHQQHHQQQQQQPQNLQNEQRQQKSTGLFNKSSSSPLPSLLNRIPGRRRRKKGKGKKKGNASLQICVPPSPSAEARLAEVEEVIQDQNNQQQQHHNVSEAVAQCKVEVAAMDRQLDANGTALLLETEQADLIERVEQYARDAWWRVGVDVVVVVTFLALGMLVYNNNKYNSIYYNMGTAVAFPKLLHDLLNAFEHNLDVDVVGLVALSSRRLLLCLVAAILGLCMSFRYIQLRRYVASLLIHAEAIQVAQQLQNQQQRQHTKKQQHIGIDQMNQNGNQSTRFSASTSRFNALRPAEIITLPLIDTNSDSIDTATCAAAAAAAAAARLPPKLIPKQINMDCITSGDSKMLLENTNENAKGRRRNHSRLRHTQSSDNQPMSQLLLPASMHLTGVRVISDPSISTNTSASATTASSNNSNHNESHNSTESNHMHADGVPSRTMSNSLRAEIVNPDTQEMRVLTDDGGIYVTQEQLHQIRALRLLIAERTEALEADIRLRHPELLPTPAHTLASVFPEIVGDVRLLRFVIGHNAVKTAAQYVNQMLQWRIDCDVAKFHNIVHNIVKQRTMDSIPYASEVVPFMPCDFFAGETPNGDWVGWESTGQIDGKKLVLEVGQPKVLEFSLSQIEAKNVMLDRNTRLKTKKYSDGVEVLPSTVDEALCKGILFKDLSGLGRRHAWPPGLKLIKEVARIAQSYYPEILRACFIVKTPLIFFAIWKVLSLCFDKSTLERVKIFRCADVSWQQQLQRMTGHSLHDLGISLLTQPNN